MSSTRPSGRYPVLADMLEGAQAVRRVRAPFPVGQFGWHRLLETIAIGSESLTDARDHRRDLLRQPAMAGVIFLAGAVQIQMQLDGGGIPVMHGPLNHRRRAR